MFQKNSSILLVFIILAATLQGSPLPNWSETVINESQMENKGDIFSQKAFAFMQSGEYRSFVTNTAVADKTALLQGDVLIINNRTYLTPEFIPSNVSSISKYDIIKTYSLFNVVYYIEKIDQDINAILNDISVPPVLQAVQATILACVYNREIIQKDKFSLYIFNNEELAKNFNFYKGQPVGSTVLEEIGSGTGLPETKPTVMFISGEADNVDEIINYGIENKILMITDHPKLLKKGVTVGVGTYSGDLKLLLNTAAVHGSESAWNSDNIFYKKL
ncbi:MAG: hypothetical protein JXQ65_05935 [Candidatus Marinimicrobia bacterium]|nr:hypothetical protein [Candidatus Neomarinimicrobiota bacterium]